MNLQPTTVPELQEMIQTHNNLLPRGGGTKPALSTPPVGAMSLNMCRLAGILEYEPGEYTFTALAGTPVSTIQSALAQHNQYLPFDPLLVQAGATLGGTVATNTNGSGRYRYGGVRDFILGIKFVDGHGRLIRSGGKVVKNAAGFDLPKFMTGSLGRYGVLVEISFKVFPQPAAYQTLQAQYKNLAATVQALFKLAPRPFEIDALDLLPEGNGRWSLVLRLGGLAAALPQRLVRLTKFLRMETEATVVAPLPDEAEFWQAANGLARVDQSATLVKVPLAMRQLPDLDTAISLLRATRWYTAGGNVAWLSVQDAAALNTVLAELGLVGLALWGGDGRLYFGQRKGESLARRVKQALDPDGKFLSDL
ncbi:MAG: FAD-binding protein [Chloroflexi bacterium]|nr:FAD-binding protein [Chloroflexota bacterium]